MQMELFENNGEVQESFRDDEVMRLPAQLRRVREWAGKAEISIKSYRELMEILSDRVQ